MKVIPKTRRAH